MLRPDDTNKNEIVPQDDTASLGTVKFGSDVNLLDFRGYSAKDLDLIMMIFLNVKDQETREVLIPYRYISKTGNYRRHISLRDLYEDLDQSSDKIMGLQIRYFSKSAYFRLNIISACYCREEDQAMHVSINSDAVSLFNDLRIFTAVDFKTYVSLTTKNAKLLYQHLCQYRHPNGTGWWHVGINDFKEMMALPKGMDPKKIMARVIKPAIEQLGPYMDITVAANRSSSKGRPVESYRFDFKNSSVIDIDAGPEQQPDPERRNDEIERLIREKLEKRISLLDKDIKAVAAAALTKDMDDKAVADACDMLLSMKGVRNAAGMLISLIKEPDKYSDPTSYSNKSGWDIESHVYDFDELEKMLRSGSSVPAQEDG